MPAMKLTPNAAMRARDVSRPRPEHLAEAEAAEASIAAGSRARTGDAGGQARGEGRGDRRRAVPGPGATARTSGEAARAPREAAATGEDQAGRRPFPRRRRGTRNPDRRDRGSR